MSIADLQRAIKDGKFSVARQLFAKLLEDPDANLPLVFCEMSVAEYRQGNLRAALVFAEAGITRLSGQTAPDRDLLGRLRLNLMGYYVEIGEHTKAVDVGLTWLKDLGDDPAAGFWSGRIHYNLGMAYRQRGGAHDNDEALRHYELAKTQFRQLRESNPGPEERERCRIYEVMALQNAAWLMLCESGKVDRAQEYAKNAGALLKPLDEASQREQVLLAAHIALRRREVDACLSLLDDFAMFGGNRASHRQRFWAAWLATHTHHLSGRPMLATAHAAIARSEADNTHEVHLIRLAADLNDIVNAPAISI